MVADYELHAKTFTVVLLLGHWSHQTGDTRTVLRGDDRGSLILRGLYPSLCDSYTMGCPHVRGDNPRALASGLSYVQVDKHGIIILYHLLYLSVDLAHRKIFRA